MVTVLRDPRMWVAAILATVVTTLGWAVVLGMFAGELETKKTASKAAEDAGPTPIVLPVIRKQEEPEQPIPAGVLAGGFAIVLFGAAGAASWFVYSRSRADEDEPTST
jgi:hypothetical protein